MDVDSDRMATDEVIMEYDEAHPTDDAMMEEEHGDVLVDAHVEGGGVEVEMDSEPVADSAAVETEMSGLDARLSNPGTSTEASVEAVTSAEPLSASAGETSHDEDSTEPSIVPVANVPDMREEPVAGPSRSPRPGIAPAQDEPEADEYAEEEPEADEDGHEDAVDAHHLPTILLRLPDQSTKALFAPAHESDWVNSRVWLEDQEEELGEASLADVWAAIREEADKAGLRGGEMVISERLMELTMGEDDSNLQNITFLELVQTYRGCGLPEPIQLHLTFMPRRFITRYLAIKQELHADKERRKSTIAGGGDGLVGDAEDEEAPDEVEHEEAGDEDLDEETEENAEDEETSEELIVTPHEPRRSARLQAKSQEAEDMTDHVPGEQAEGLLIVQEVSEDPDSSAEKGSELPGEAEDVPEPTINSKADDAEEIIDAEEYADDVGDEEEYAEEDEYQEDEEDRQEEMNTTEAIIGVDEEPTAVAPGDDEHAETAEVIEEGTEETFDDGVDEIGETIIQAASVEDDHVDATEVAEEGGEDQNHIDPEANANAEPDEGDEDAGNTSAVPTEEAQKISSNDVLDSTVETLTNGHHPEPDTAEIASALEPSDKPAPSETAHPETADSSAALAPGISQRSSSGRIKVPVDDEDLGDEVETKSTNGKRAHSDEDDEVSGKRARPLSEEAAP